METDRMEEAKTIAVRSFAAGIAVGAVVAVLIAWAIGMAAHR